MWDFSSDEWLALIFAVVVSAWAGRRWYGPLLTARPHATRRWRRTRAILAIAPIVGLAPTAVVLARGADPARVAGHADYVTLFMVGAAACLLAVPLALSIGGISVRDDAIERDNPAATTAAVGLLWGVGLCYAGANVGAGATVWTTFVPALLAIGALCALGLAVAALGAAEAISVGRDLAGGIRLATAFICAGAILGRAVAGDFVSWSGLFADFLALGWPAAALMGLAATSEAFLKPTAQRPAPNVAAFGMAPAAIFVLLTVGCLIQRGAPTVARVW